MSSTVKEIKEKTGYLKRSDLYTIGVGQAIGSGVLTLIGPAILLTGQSAWLAYVAACIWGFMMIAPIPWITSTLKLGGGFYSLVGDMAGKRVAGMYAVGFLPQTINLATYGVAIGMYANSLWPQINAKWFGIAALSVFFAINLCGVDVMAYVAACIWGFMMIAPIPWITSTLKLGGGFYSLVGDMAGKRVAGMYAVGFLPQTINLATYGVAIGMYANSLWPQINAKWFGIAALSVFFAINLCGVDVMAKVQKILVILLFVALGLFIVLGCLQLKNPVFEFTAPDFFSNGPSGFFSAIMLYVYSTNGYSCIMNYGKQAKEAHKDIPKALLYCIPTLMVVYGGVAIVASGVLPLDQVAGQPLTLVAKNILNPALFTVFMIGGPVLALSSSINSTISNNCIPVAQSCKDGWLPKSWAAQNRRGAYWKLMTFTYLMGILPVLLDFSISDVVNNIMLLASALAFLQIYAYFQLPKKHAEAWEKSPMHISNGKYYFLCCLSLFAYICIFINSCRSLKLPVVIISLIAIVVCMAYGWFRSVSPDVKMETSVWED